MKDRLVLYHGNCYDGVTAAAICYQKFGDFETKYMPMLYGEPVPDVDGMNVLMVDFCFKAPQMQEIISRSKSLTLLDHHKTAEAELAFIESRPGIDLILFDMERSGAGLAWDFLYPKRSRPIVVDYVEDRDLWRFCLPGSKNINAWIQSWDINLDTWITKVMPRANDPKIEFEGSNLLRLEEKYVRQIADTAYWRKIPGTDIVAPYVYTPILMSEVCHELLQRYLQTNIVFYSFRRASGRVQYGLRSTGDTDVSIIAKMNGGGGHRNAAGFELDE